MNLIGGWLRQWWRWSTGKGKTRKVVGFGVPAVLLAMVLIAITPERDETIGGLPEPPTSIALTSTATATATSAPGAEAPSPTSGAAVTTTPVPSASSPASGAPPRGLEAAVVERVIDGDTVILEGGRRLRYIGIDTPETVAPGEPVACYGPEASARNEALVLGQTVFLEPDVNDTDRFDRLLRYVYLEDGRMVNEVLVAEGYATSETYSPDTKHQDIFDAAEEAARSGGLGRWSACPTGPSPTATPLVVPDSLGSGAAGECPQGCETPPEGCAIKGNISSEHIYHVPGQQHYEDTIIDPEKGERWFCTEAEAVANGWRAALR